MVQDDAVVFKTFVGRERTVLGITHGDYHRWLDNIRTDQPLMAAIGRVLAGDEEYLGLDDGDAGVFPERIFPYSRQVEAKLDWLDAGKQSVLTSFMLRQRLKDLAKSQG